MLCCLQYCWAKGSFFHKIYFTAQLLFQFAMHTCIGKQPYVGSASVKSDKYVHVRIISLLSTGKGTEEPSLQDGLGLEVFGYLLCHCLSTHIVWHL